MKPSTRRDTDESKPAEKHLPDVVVIAWILSIGVLVTLAIFVTRQLATTGAGHAMHSSGDAVFRAHAPETTKSLLGRELLTAWQLDAPSIALVALIAISYLALMLRQRRRTPDNPWPLLRLASLVAGLVTIVFATCGSIAVYDKALFTAHMLGHLSLVMVAPAFLVAAHPLGLAVRACNPVSAERIRRIAASGAISLFTSPPVAIASYTAVIVGSHLTGLMDDIMTSTWAGQVEHLVYILVGCQFFALILGDEPLRWRLSTPIRWLLLAISMAVDTFTGLVLMMGTKAVTMQAPAGIDPLSDTKTGGAIMWFGGDAIMAALMIILTVAWLRTSGQGERDRSSWLEQARRQSLGERQAIDLTSNRDNVDDDDADRAAYNRWLSGL